MNKGELKAAVLDTLVRQDLSGKPIVDSWVTAATTRLNQDLLVQEMLTRVTHTVTSPVSDFPPDFIAVKTMKTTAGDFGATGQQLVYAPPEEITKLAQAWACDYPGYYTTYGREFELAPWRSNTSFNIDLWYYGEILDLVLDTSTNAILTKYPQLYINLVCSMGHQYLLENDAAMSREAMAMSEMQRIMARREAEQYGQGPLIIRPSRRIGGRFS